MSDAVITTLISSGFILLGTIITTVITAIQTRNKTGNKIDAVEEKLDAHIKDDAWATAKQARIRILRFNDEICSGRKYSENHWEDIIEDIDFYETFCAKHPDYHNNKGVLAIEHIKQVYQQRKADNDFLK